MKELDSSFHIIQHFRHDDKPSRCLNVKRTSERIISLQQAMQAMQALGQLINNRSNFWEERIIVRKIAVTFREE